MNDKNKVIQIKAIIEEWRNDSGDNYGDEDFINDVIKTVEDKDENV